MNKNLYNLIMTVLFNNQILKLLNMKAILVTIDSKSI